MAELAPTVAAVREASRRIVRQLGFLQEHWEPTDLSFSQCHTLTELARAGSLNVAELAELLNLDHSSASRAVTGLVRRGAVESTPDPVDGRRRTLRLTAVGRELVADVDNRAGGQVTSALALLDADTRGQVVAGLRAYAGALERARAAAQVEIRPLRPADDPAMERVIRRVMTEYGASGPGFSIHDPEVAAMSAAYQPPSGAYFVAVRGREILGGAGVAPLVGGSDASTCELKKMYLLTAGRGLGVGQRLLDRCLAAARDLGYRRCYLETLESMVEARRLYERNGFRPLAAAEGCTGHFGCDRWYARSLTAEG
jgi:putative acetyltransferase